MKGYRTIIFNIVMTGLMTLQLWNPGADAPDAAAVNEGLDALEAGIAFVWGLGNLFLRSITNSAIFKKVGS